MLLPEFCPLSDILSQVQYVRFPRDFPHIDISGMGVLDILLFSRCVCIYMMLIYVVVSELPIWLST